MDAGRKRAQLERILASAAFSGAERSSSFLRVVVGLVLEGRKNEIKEFVIAVDALGRDSSFDPKSDPIVRVEAGRLRDRLNSYYEEEGRLDPVLVSLPKGGYVPEFSERRFAAAPSNVVRLSILPPGNSTFESFAISPDGRKLACTVFLRGQLTLCLRPLDSLEMRPLAGTDFASHPFWSPDSKSIGFFTPSMLRTVDIAGGPARDVAGAVVGLGAAWNPDGTIVFSPRPLGILCRVPAAGGTPEPLTELDPARAEVAHAYPHFLPDGRHFLFLACSSRRGLSAIRMGSLDGGPSTILMNADAGAAFTQALSGHSASVVFLHAGALMAQPFNVTRLELEGERTVIAPEVRYQRWREPGFSVSGNGALLYQVGIAGSRQLAWFGRNGRVLETVGPRNDYIAFRLSPDEQYAAASRFDDPDTMLQAIWVMDLGREGAVSRFTDAGIEEAEISPVWSHGSREILFGRGDDRVMCLQRRGVSGGTAQTILETEGPKFPTDWSRDGMQIAYGSQWPDFRHMHIWTAELNNGARPFVEHPYNAFSAHFSPCVGKRPQWLAYMSDETGRFEVYVRDFPSGARKWQISRRGGLQPQWRSDGSELFFLTLEGTLMVVAIAPGTDFECGAPQPLFETDLVFSPHYRIWMDQYAVSRDGQRFLINRPVAEPDGGAITAMIPW